MKGIFCFTEMNNLQFVIERVACMVYNMVKQHSEDNKNAFIFDRCRPK